MYEVVWVRLLALVFGNTVYAVGVVLAAFMSGLSFGSFLLGRLADKRDNMLKIYGILELGIALSAVASPVLLKGITSIYVSTYDSSSPIWILSGLRYFLSAAVLLVPTTLMGGTLPVLSRYFIRAESQLESRVGQLYSVNTLGGVVGTFLVGFLLIRYVGLNFTIHATALVNILIGGFSFYLGTRLSEADRVTEELMDKRGDRPKGYSYALLAFFLSGFSALVYEVAWSRLLVGVIGSTTYAFSLILMGFLLGIGAGSFLVSRISFRRRLDMSHFSAIQIAIALVCFSTIALFNVMPYLMHKGLVLLGQSYEGVLAIEFLLVLLYILVPTTLFGATFPIIAGVYSEGGARRGRNIGNIYAANTAGCILGSIVAAFLLLPLFGSTFSVKAAVVINLVVGLGGLFLLGKRRLAVAAAGFLVLPLLPVSVPQKLLNSGVAIYGTHKGFLQHSSDFFLQYASEGLNANIAVVAATTGSLTLRTNGKADASSSTIDMPTQLASGYFPIFLHQQPEKVMVVGLGSGVTLKAVSDFPDVKKIDCIEIEPAVAEAAKLFEDVNKGVLGDPRVKIIMDDARNYITATKETYDIIISEPSNPWISGIGNLFSREFYQASLRRLRRGGIFCQWVQMYSLRQEDLQMILKTFSSVFPESNIWAGSKADIILIGSWERFEGFNYDAVGARIGGRAYWDLKAYLNISDPMDFFSYFITDRQGVDALSRGASVNTDDIPLLEFSAPYSLYKGSSTDLYDYLHSAMRLPEIRGYKNTETIVPELLYRKTRNYLSSDIPVSVSWIKNALKFDPSNPDFMVQLAKVKFKTDSEAAQAESLLRRALSIDPENAETHFSLGRLIGVRKQEAAGHLYKAASLNGDEFEYVNSAAASMFQEGRSDEALKYSIKSLQLPHPAEYDQHIYRNIALSLRQKKDYPAAVIFFEKSIHANPYRPDTYIDLADIYIMFARKDLACEHLQRALLFSTLETKDLVKEKLDHYCTKK